MSGGLRDRGKEQKRMNQTQFSCDFDSGSRRTFVRRHIESATSDIPAATAETRIAVLLVDIETGYRSH